MSLVGTGCARLPLGSRRRQSWMALADLLTQPRGSLRGNAVRLFAPSSRRTRPALARSKSTSRLLLIGQL